ncbi:hypothetical protein KIH23_10915 [Flavobacterium sp. CYK-55]|uniref:hypothetical protein n=1 Tax=Flavobacterium sp. CYK-55 TaxID=2835529 RepID=UPI001BCB89A1|nr:hypothetical protein [Flavobacterium sp. CYK-55]MBS7787807.1 hypothetical protein [Flavobacterium sp. CYK-55]
MDFNELQSAWNNDHPNPASLPHNLDRIQSANTPLDRIKKNLKNEFIYQIISIVILGFAPAFYAFPQNAILPFYLMFAIFVAVCIYYLVKLYLFYRRLAQTTLNTKDSLYETYYEIRINMELYKTFGFALTPFLILFLIGFWYLKMPETVLSESGNHTFLMAAFCIVVFCILFMGIALEWWVHYFYGKYARELKKVIDQLKEE